jgi:hypothetical protein
MGDFDLGSNSGSAASSSMILGKALYLSKTQFLHQQNGTIDGGCLPH